MGAIQQYTLENGKKFRAYIPDNVSDDTPVLYYSYLVGRKYENDSLWQGYEKNMIEQNPNSIIIIPEDLQLVVGSDNFATHKYQTNAVSAVELLEKELGIDTTQFTNSGFSAGFGFSVRTTGHYLQLNPDAERQVLIAVDGVMNDTTCIQKSELQAIKNNNSILISYSQPQNFNYQAKKLKSTGLPILYVVDPSVPEKSGNKYWGYHDYMTKNFFASGLYEELMQFVNGKGELPENYTYRVYDPQTGQIREISRDEVASFFNIEEYVEREPFTFSTLSTLNDYELKSKSSVMTSHLNNIKSSITSSAILSSTWSDGGFSSTTQVPSEIPTICNEFFTSTSELITKLANDLFEFAKVKTSIEDLNNELKKEAEELNTKTTITTNNKTISNENKVVNTKPSNSNIIINNNKEINNKPSNNSTNNNYYPNNNSTFIPPIVNQNNKVEETTKEEFPEYKEIYSDEDKLVYEYEYETGEKYKILIYKDKNNNITGIEHYYEYSTKKEASKALSSIKEEYNQLEHFDKVIQDNNHIKIIFKSSMYEDMTIKEVVDKYYKDLEEVLKEE